MGSVKGKKDMNDQLLDERQLFGSALDTLLFALKHWLRSVKKIRTTFVKQEGELVVANLYSNL